VDVISRGTVNYCPAAHPLRSEASEPRYSPCTCPILVFVWGGRRWNDLNCCIGATGKLHRPAIKITHAAAEFSASSYGYVARFRHVLRAASIRLAATDAMAIEPLMPGRYRGSIFVIAGSSQIFLRWIVVRKIIRRYSPLSSGNQQIDERLIQEPTTL
jgi:hypothetical protein